MHWNGKTLGARRAKQGRGGTRSPLLGAGGWVIRESGAEVAPEGGSDQDALLPFGQHGPAVPNIVTDLLDLTQHSQATVNEQLDVGLDRVGRLLDEGKAPVEQVAGAFDLEPHQPGEVRRAAPR